MLRIDFIQELGKTLRFNMGLARRAALWSMPKLRQRSGLIPTRGETWIRYWCCGGDRGCWAIQLLTPCKDLHLAPWWDMTEKWVRVAGYIEFVLKYFKQPTILWLFSSSAISNSWSVRRHVHNNEQLPTSEFVWHLQLPCSKKSGLPLACERSSAK